MLKTKINHRENHLLQSEYYRKSLDWSLRLSLLIDENGQRMRVVSDDGAPKFEIY